LALQANYRQEDDIQTIIANKLQEIEQLSIQPTITENEEDTI
jgi:hypothetical protein